MAQRAARPRRSISAGCFIARSWATSGLASLNVAPGSARPKAGKSAAGTKASSRPMRAFVSPFSLSASPSRSSERSRLNVPGRGVGAVARDKRPGAVLRGIEARRLHPQRMRADVSDAALALKRRRLQIADDRRQSAVWMFGDDEEGRSRAPPKRRDARKGPGRPCQRLRLRQHERVEAAFAHELRMRGGDRESRRASLELLRHQPVEHDVRGRAEDKALHVGARGQHLGLLEDEDVRAVIPQFRLQVLVVLLALGRRRAPAPRRRSAC